MQAGRRSRNAGPGNLCHHSGMQIPWGDVAVADAHVHFFSHRFFHLLAQQAPALSVEQIGERLGWRMPPEDPVALARDWVAELDRHKVARAALIASLPQDEDSVAAAVAAFPDRFYGYFMVNPCAEQSPARVARLLEGKRLRVLCLFPAMHGYSIWDARALAVLEAAAGTPSPVVFVHCGVLSVGVRKKLGLASPFDLRFSNPVDLHGIALRYPHVRFIIPHFGAGYFREALMLADLCPNVYLDTSSSNQWVRYHCPQLSLTDVFRRALDVAGAQRLLFGTDSSFFPRGWNRAVFDAQVQALYEIGVTEAQARAIFGGNLQQLLA